MDSEQLEEYVLSVIDILQRNREEKHLHPVSVSINEINAHIRQDVKQTLNSLVKKGLEWHPDISQAPMFNIRR